MQQRKKQISRVDFGLEKPKQANKQTNKQKMCVICVEWWDTGVALIGDTNLKKTIKTTEIWKKNSPLTRDPVCHNPTVSPRLRSSLSLPLSGFFGCKARPSPALAVGGVARPKSSAATLSGKGGIPRWRSPPWSGVASLGRPAAAELPAARMN